MDSFSGPGSLVEEVAPLVRAARSLGWRSRRSPAISGRFLSAEVPETAGVAVQGHRPLPTSCVPDGASRDDLVSAERKPDHRSSIQSVAVAATRHSLNSGSQPVSLSLIFSWVPGFLSLSGRNELSETASIALPGTEGR